jgi:hypothetical protein
MTEERQTLRGEDVVDKAKKLIHEGNVRRVIVKNDDRVVAEFPLTLGLGVSVAAIAVAPVLAAIGAIAALISNISIEIEKDDDAGGPADTGSDGETPPPA